MKRILVALVLLALPALAAAQETYSLGANANQAAKVERRRLQINRDTCLRVGAAGGATCSQAQACVAAGAVSGASCNTNQARAVNAEIFANTQPGREAMLIQRIFLPAFVDFQTQAVAEDAAAYCVWWKDPATTRAAKDLDCNKTNPPRGNDCELCP